MKKNPNNSFYKQLAFLLFAVFIATPSYALAAGTAALSISPAGNSYIVGNTFTVLVQVSTDSDSTSINAAEADIHYDSSVLSFDSIGAGIFNEWIEYPDGSVPGTIHFSGGIKPPGFSGTTPGTIFTIKFNAKAQSPNTTVSFANAQVLANDGYGTNILNSTSNGVYTINPPPPVPPSVSWSAPSVDPDQPVTFKATPSPASGAPYTYSWSDYCPPGTDTCTNSSGYSTSGGHSDVLVTATDKYSQSVTHSCSVTVNGPSVSCSVVPNPVDRNQPVNFTATPSGGAGATYTYSWTNCTSTTDSCSSPGGYSASSQDVQVSVADKDGNHSSTSCSVAVNAPPGFGVSCSASPTSANTGDQVTFDAFPSGGSGATYTYSWSGACTGTSPDCSTSFSSSGPQTATVTVASGIDTTSGSCTVYINVVCPVVTGGTGAPPSSATPTTIIQTTQQAVQQATQQVAAATTEVKKAVKTPAGSIVTKAVSATGVVATAVAVAVASSFSLPAMLLIPFRLFGLMMVAFGIRKKSKYWGVVYDSVTKQSIDPAYVTLQTLEGKDISSVTTDIEGRYGFLVEPDIYKIMVRKTNYSFPSRNLFGKANDEIYSDLYFGEGMEVKTLGESVNKNIPMDPVKFDWNEFAKKDKGLVRFYSKLDLLARRISNIFFVAGFAVAAGSLYFDYNIYNVIILGIYALLTILMMLGFRPRSYGSLIDQKTGNPLSFAIVHVVESSLNKEISRKVADKYGRYYALVPKGQYYLKIEKKNDDSSYSLVYTSPAIDVTKRGIINKTFRIQ